MNARAKTFAISFVLATLLTAGRAWAPWCGTCKFGAGQNSWTATLLSGGTKRTVPQQTDAVVGTAVVGRGGVQPAPEPVGPDACQNPEWCFSNEPWPTPGSCCPGYQCSNARTCDPKTDETGHCNDLIDNDHNGAIDCSDTVCGNDPICFPNITDYAPPATTLINAVCTKLINCPILNARAGGTEYYDFFLRMCQAQLVRDDKLPPRFFQDGVGRFPNGLAWAQVNDGVNGGLFFHVNDPSKTECLNQINDFGCDATVTDPILKEGLNISKAAELLIGDPFTLACGHVFYIGAIPAPSSSCGDGVCNGGENVDSCQPDCCRAPGSHCDRDQECCSYRCRESWDGSRIVSRCQ
jgi:hypothetical protein